MTLPRVGKSSNWIQDGFMIWNLHFSFLLYCCVSVNNCALMPFSVFSCRPLLCSRMFLTARPPQKTAHFLRCFHFMSNPSATYSLPCCEVQSDLSFILFTQALDFAGGVKGDISRCPQLERAHSNSNGIILLRNWGGRVLRFTPAVGTNGLQLVVRLWLIRLHLLYIWNWKLDSSLWSPAGCGFASATRALSDSWLSRTNAFVLEPELIGNYQILAHCKKLIMLGFLCTGGLIWSVCSKWLFSMQATPLWRILVSRYIYCQWL